MNRRDLIRIGVLSGLSLLGAPMINPGHCRLMAKPLTVEVSTAAIDLVLESVVIDMLGLLTLDWDRLFAWQERPAAFIEADFRKLESSGISIFHPAVEPAAKNPHEAAKRWLRGWKVLLDNRPCFLGRIDQINDLIVVPKQRKIGVIVGFQNSEHFRAAADVETFYNLGQRVSQLTYNTKNRLGSGCKVDRDRGLTRFGAEVVAEMNRLGMAIDVSHCGDRTALDAIAASRKPVLITHSNCRALVPGQPRCKPDEVIRRMAKVGGVMGITLVRAFVSPRRSPTIDDVLDHFDHVARLVGVEHIGLGSDVDLDAIDPSTGRLRAPYRIRGLNLPVRVFQLTEGLLRRGHSKDDIRLVLGGNFQRALFNIWSDSAAWRPIPNLLTRRDPFCPAPDPKRIFGRSVKTD